MKFSCENCGTRYTLPDEKVKNRILKIRCKVCEHVIVVRDNQSAAAAELPPPPARDVEWYTSSGGSSPDGPMPKERLLDRIRSGRLARTDMVWNQSMTDWVRAETVFGDQFKARQPSARAPKPPPLRPLGGAPRPPTPLAPKPLAPKPLAPKPLSGLAAPGGKAPVFSDATQAMSPDFNSLFADLEPGTPARGSLPVTIGSAADDSILSAPPPDVSAPPAEPSAPPAEPSAPPAEPSMPPAEPSAPPSNDTAIALPGADTLLAPAATASALAAMEDGDTTALPELSAATDWAGVLKDSSEAPAIPEAPEHSPLLGLLADPPDGADPDLSLPGVAQPESAPASAAPPPAVETPSAEAPAVETPVDAAADDGDAARLSSAQSALVEDAFFSDAHPAIGSAAHLDEPEERPNRMPLFILLAVVLLGGGIALGVMIGDRGDGGSPESTASAASDAPATEAPATEAPATEAPASLAAASTASEAPASEAPASEAPATEAPASAASAAPATKAKPKQVAAAPKSKPKRVAPKATKSAAPATASRFAKLSGQKAKPAGPDSAALATEAVEALPETLSPSRISRIIKRYKKGLHGCYQRQLKRDSSMRKASLKLAFNIERSGRTSNIKIDRKYNGTELKNCLNRLVRRWRFPKFTGAAIPVEYPLFFQAAL